MCNIDLLNADVMIKLSSTVKITFSQGSTADLQKNYLAPRLDTTNENQ